jgi:hypothetical protein
MGRVLRAGLLGLALLSGLLAASAAPLSGRAPARGLDQSLAADLEDVPLASALKAIAARLALEPKDMDVADPPLRIRTKVPRVSAEVLLLVLAWQTNREWVLTPGVLRWGPPHVLPAAELAQYRRERTLRLEHKALLLRRRLGEPLPFRLKVEDVPLADILRFLQRELSVPLFLDPRASDELKAPVRSEFADLRPGGTVAELLDRLLSGPSGSDRGSTSASAAGGAGRPGGARQSAGAPRGRGERAKGAPGPTGGPAPVGALGWTVVGDLVVVSTPAHLYSLKSLSP